MKLILEKERGAENMCLILQPDAARAELPTLSPPALKNKQLMQPWGSFSIIFQ